MKPKHCIGCVKDCSGFTQKQYKRCPLGVISEAKIKGVPILDITHPAECRAVPMKLNRIERR